MESIAIYINEDTGEEYKPEYKYCKVCGAELEVGKELGTLFSRVTGLIEPGNEYIGCPRRFPYKGDHDYWVKIDMNYDILGF